MNRPHPRSITAATVLLGVISLLTAVVYFTTIPDDPPGDGFAAGLTGLFVMLCLIIGTLTLVEAGLLFLLTQFRDPTERSQQLLSIGAGAGSCSVVLLVVPMLIAQVVGGLPPAFLTSGSGIGLLLVPVGIGCSGIGAVLHLVDEFRAGNRA
ncbi:hypothetical protein [Natrinema versiforme]|uniref:DUF2975 domain-containing protein n=1 Tax=Natrinema versiforme TaxID=88724 RepID=A0A4P8WI51_9EURY|nr:hypothetical protein [Natrinema versiforme]QCS42884.1 hypothetical protein FEJ81_11130 [Natrinema versiforme]